MPCSTTTLVENGGLKSYLLDSIGAFGLWIEDAVPAFPVAGITISGNLGDLLQGVELVGGDLRFHGTTTVRPSSSPR